MSESRTGASVKRLPGRKAGTFDAIVSTRPAKLLEFEWLVIVGKASINDLFA
ncbi:hypothetical protein [Rhizobium sp. NRK18]|jgi:hypothetical protein|uniref:hypothetical protein n=1 Tax=Rhizobium sp. NRK18 TaxID=2964667 RepID=UPI0021C2E5F6|nr:hypothetical protein [Rhizobium sp. NRK18]MCQ2005583.1 hypothetical protein [Rhizobium sp. NRK18]